MLNSEEMRKKLLTRLEQEKREFTMKSMHFLERPLKTGTELLIGPNKYKVHKDAFLVVVDEDPGAYWTHPVCYELHDTETEEVIVIREEYPLEKPDLKTELLELHIPDLPHLKKKDEHFFKFQHKELKKLEERFRSISYDLSRPCTAHKHALFVAGMNNMVDFYNDFVNMRNILIDRYGYDPANIVIVMGDGTGYPDLPVDYAGTVADLNTALDEYAPGGIRELGPDDSLFLYTFNHGGFDAGNAYLCMHPTWGKYYDYQLRAKLDNINCNELIVAMNQCHSGGFVDDVVATTGPNHVAIMTTCRHDQSGHPAATGDHGYFSVILCTALNWLFPVGTNPAFPGYVAGTITTQDTNSDGMIAAEEAWHYVHDMMHAHHWYTINGLETPQWGESSAGEGANLFWGRPDIEVEDGTPWWESPDVYLHNPTVIPDETTAVPTHPDNWGDSYHPDTLNRIVARVHNTGCAPCRNTTVEFRAMSFGVGGGTTLIGSFMLNNIDPGHHAFAWVDWNFPSSLIHRCVMVRADCEGDPALPFSGGNIPTDDNQAQRNLDPAYSAPVSGNPDRTEKIIERHFTIHNDLDKDAVFGISLAKSKFSSRLIRAKIIDSEALRMIPLKPGEAQEVTIRVVIPPQVKVGEKLHFPIQVRRIRPNATIVGGVTFTIEVATGHLEGHVISRERIPMTEGMVTIENIKQRGQKYTAKVGRKGTFSFKNIDPGSYRILAHSNEGYAKESVTVLPNTLTTKILLFEYLPKLVGGILKDERGKPLANNLVAVRDTEAKRLYLLRTDALGTYRIPNISPGEYEITMPDKKEVTPKKVRLNLLSPEKME